MRFSGSLSPVSEDEETEYDSATGLNEKIHMGVTRRTIDSTSQLSHICWYCVKLKNVETLATADEVIRDLTKLQSGTIVLSSLTFALTLLELLCV